MAHLIPFPASGLSATYTVETKTLKVVAKGTVKGLFYTPYLQRDTFMGGLKYSLMGHYGGAWGKDHQLETSVSEQLILPQWHFQSKTLIVETALGQHTVTINYNGFIGDTDGIDLPGGAEFTHPPQQDKSAAVVGDVLPPLKRSLPMGQTLDIRAQIPPLRRSGVVIEFNREYLTLFSATASNNEIIWMIQWAKAPSGNADPQFVQVKTDEWNGEVGPASKTLRTVQTYIVSLVVKG